MKRIFTATAVLAVAAAAFWAAWFFLPEFPAKVVWAIAACAVLIFFLLRPEGEVKSLIQIPKWEKK